MGTTGVISYAKQRVYNGKNLANNGTYFFAMAPLLGATGDDSESISLYLTNCKKQDALLCCVVQ